VIAVSPPCASDIAAPLEVFVSPRLVRRISIGTTPAPASTMICRHTLL
jgi:hypothetical protein